MRKVTLTIMAAALLLTLLCSHAMADGSAKTSAQGSANVATGSAQVGSGALQGASGVSAVPFKVSGAVGQASDKVGEGLAGSAGSGPLPVTEETITAGPAPDKAMQ